MALIFLLDVDGIIMSFKRTKSGGRCLPVDGEF